MTASLVAAYRKGAITADHLVVQCLHMVDPEAPGLVLDPLPDELIVRTLEFAPLSSGSHGHELRGLADGGPG